MTGHEAGRPPSADAAPPGDGASSGDAASSGDEASSGDAHPSRESRRPSVRIGITGPIGCGKSTVAAWLAELGAVVIDADLVAREVTPPGSPELEAVAREFGPEVVQADGTLDRAALGRVVFADPGSLARLEAIIHPAVRPLILHRLTAAEREGARAVVVEAIKLVEGGLATLCDEVWLVTCAPAAQRARLAARGADPADTEARIAAQSDLVDRLAPAATRIIDTSGSIAATLAAVRAAYESVVRAASSDAVGDP